MEQINSKQDLINYFEKGCKKENQLSIGVEHEKFVFDNSTNQRANFKTISKIFNFLEQFGWKVIKLTSLKHCILLLGIQKYGDYNIILKFLTII